MHRHRKHKSKDKALVQHAKNRAGLRYGVSLSIQDLENIVKLIKQQKGNHLGRQSNRVSHWEIEYKEQTMHVVYDKIRSKIITFLPR